MFSEDYIIFNMNYVHYIIYIVLPEVLQNLKFNTCLIIIFLLVFYNLNSYLLFCLMINAPDSRSKATSSQIFAYFISITNMIPNYNLIITLIIVISIIMVVYLLLFLIMTIVTFGWTIFLLILFSFFLFLVINCFRLLIYFIFL